MMSIDSISEVDKKFFADNLLLGEDWQDSITHKFDDFPGFLDLDSHFNSDDFIPDLPDNLSIPMLDDTSSRDIDMAEPWKDPGDSSDSGLSSIDCGPVNMVKVEPLSPVPSNYSDGSYDSFSHSVNTIDNFANFNLSQEIKLESPPLTPPHDIMDSFISSSNIPNGVPTTPPHSNGLVQITKVVPVTTQPTVNDGVTQVLNSKVKIQPKPISAIQTKASLSPSTTNKPLVLTAEEFAKLTAKGVLKFQPPGQDLKVPVSTAKTLVPPKTTPTSLPPSVVHVNSLPVSDTITDNKAWKRQQRMIKNRESACLSRRRKKEYLTTVEDKLKDYNTENERLIQENTLLRKKIEHLQAENEKLKRSFPFSNSTKKVTCLLGILFMISLNLGPMSSILMNNSDPILNSNSRNIPLSNTVIHHGRSLLSVSDDAVNDTGPNGDRQKNLDSLQATVNQFHKTMKYLQGRQQMDDWNLLKDLPDLDRALSMCPPYFNSSESQRLMQDLTGWVLAHKSESRQAQEDKQMDEIRKMLKQRRKRYKPPRKVKAAMKGKFMPEYSSDRSKYQVQMFQRGDNSYIDFLDTIHRRNDTFYVVSFRNDHFLLPATAHNKTMRPRMSLVMPAPHVPLNESMQPPAGSVAMMQIDCEVIDTRLVHVHKSAVPESQRENFNASSDSFKVMQQQKRQEGHTEEDKFKAKRSHKFKGRL